MFRQTPRQQPRTHYRDPSHLMYLVDRWNRMTEEQEMDRTTPRMVVNHRDTRQRRSQWQNHRDPRQRRSQWHNHRNHRQCQSQQLDLRRP